MIVAPTTLSPLDDILQRAKALPPVRAAVVNPYDDLVLGGALTAAKEGLIHPTFVGDAHAIRAVARRAQRFPPDMHIENALPGQEAKVASTLAAGGAVKMLVKGSIRSDALLHDVLAERLVHEQKRLSHVVVTELPGRA